MTAACCPVLCIDVDLMKKQKFYHRHCRLTILTRQMQCRRHRRKNMFSLYRWAIKVAAVAKTGLTVIMTKAAAQVANSSVCKCFNS